MRNPWFDVPLSDYEGHMGSAEVGQLRVLSDLFAEVLALRRPTSVAVLGVAGGNGLERIDPKVTRRVVGFDFNQRYLDEVERRYSEGLPLQLHCVDLAGGDARCDEVELVHAALIFEHAGVGRCLENAVALVAPRGALSVVLQLPSEVEQGVSATPFASIQNLKDHFTFVDPAWLRETMQRKGFRLVHEARRELAAGKAFWMGVWEREAVG